MMRSLRFGVLLSCMVGVCSACQPSASAPSGSVAQPAAAPAGAPSVAPPAARETQVSVQNLKSLQDAGQVPLLLDVRSPGEYASGHVPGAQNLPLDQLEARLAELEAHRGAPVYVICEVGGRSSVAARVLNGKGYQGVNVEGGTRAWRAQGYPTE